MAFKGIIAAEGSKANRCDGATLEEGFFLVGAGFFLSEFIGKMFGCVRNCAVQ